MNRCEGVWAFAYPKYPMKKTKSRLLNTVARSSFRRGEDVTLIAII